MKNLLVINASGRVSRSITRRLTRQFAEQWQRLNPAGCIVDRDVGQAPPAPVDEAWIASAFTAPADRTPDMQQALAQSEQLLAELEAADVVIIGAPMYNFGVPASLKAYFDQIIRVNRSFSFDKTAEEPYQPMLVNKPVILVLSVGDGTLLSDGEMSDLNFLEPHLATMLNFIGLSDLHFVRVGFEEFQDGRLKRSLERAEAMIRRLAEHLPPNTPAPRTSNLEPRSTQPFYEKIPTCN